MIGPISPDVKQMGARSAGNPHAACDVEGAGNVARSGCLGQLARQSSTLLAHARKRSFASYTVCTTLYCSHYRVTHTESCPYYPISPVHARSAGNPHAACDVEGAGNVARSGCLGQLARQSSTLPGKPFFIPSPAIRFPERAEGVKGPKR